MNRFILFVICILGYFPGRSQIINNYYFVDNSKAIIDSLESVAIIPGWVQLKPEMYSGLPEKLEVAEEEASLFFQDLLYSSFLLTNSSKLRDNHVINSLLVDRRKEFPRISLNLSPVELFEIRGF